MFSGGNKENRNNGDIVLNIFIQVLNKSQQKDTRYKHKTDTVLILYIYHITGDHN